MRELETYASRLRVVLCVRVNARSMVQYAQIFVVFVVVVVAVDFADRHGLLLSNQ